MGRYYNTQRHHGKFGFGVQDSNDPEIFGMLEDTGVIHYYLNDDEETREHIKEVLDEQFDFLEVPTELRKYEFETDKDISKYLDETITEYCFKDILEEDQTKDQLPFYCEKEGYVSVEKKRGSFLAKCRLSLGFKILDDLIKDGFCELDAEV